jgi:tetratricopeptide (TPR) repeat protein
MPNLTQRLGVPRYEADEFYRQALAAYQKKQFEQALTRLGQAIDVLPTRAEYYAARGFIHLENHSDRNARAQAEADFDVALRLHPFEMLAHYGRGLLAYGDGNWEDAVMSFSRALAADPDRPETLYYLALSYHRQRNTALALGYMRQALSRFEQTDDRRRADAARWVRELEK